MCVLCDPLASSSTPFLLQAVWSPQSPHARETIPLLPDHYHNFSIGDAAGILSNVHVEIDPTVRFWSEGESNGYVLNKAMNVSALTRLLSL